MKLFNTVLSGLIAFGFVTLQATAESKDVWLASKVKMALLSAEGVSVRDADVVAAGGAVTLHGQVRTGAEKAKAGYVVSALAGVKSVRNLILIAPQAFATPVRIDDDTLRQSVESVLRADARLGGVKVASVENGVVTIEGVTGSGEEKVRAIELVWAVPGVCRVADRIEAGK